MYARIPQLQQLAADAERRGDPRPVMLCEYAHSMGNSTGNLHEYWQAFEECENGRLIGGFIWDWADQALLKAQPQGNCGSQVCWFYNDLPQWCHQQHIYEGREVSSSTNK
jgi:beta-galactosidase/beta-glucuronidase